MDNALLKQIFISWNNLAKNLKRIRFRQLLFLANILSQAAMGTILHHQVVVLCRFYHLLQFYNVFVIKAFMDFYLGLQHLEVGPSKFL